MTTYTCDNFRPVKLGQTSRDGWDVVEGPKDAAKIFANRIAKQEFGKRGYCHHVRQDCWREDGAYVVYEAFVGVSVKGDQYACSGRNVWLTVHIRRDDDADTQVSN